MKNRFDGAIGSIPLSFRKESLCLSGYYRNPTSRREILPKLRMKKRILLEMLSPQDRFNARRDNTKYLQYSSGKSRTSSRKSSRNYDEDSDYEDETDFDEQNDDDDDNPNYR